MDVEEIPSVAGAGRVEVEQREEDDAAMELSRRADQEPQEAALGSLEQEMEEEKKSTGLNATQRMVSVNLEAEETRNVKRRACTAGSVKEVAEQVRAAASGAAGSGWRSRRCASASDEEAGELKRGGIETLTQLMVSLVLRWRRLKTTVPTCSTLNAQFAARRAAAIPATSSVWGGAKQRPVAGASSLRFPERQRVYLPLRSLHAERPAGQAGQAASDVALNWLAQKGVEHPAQRIDVKLYHFPHTHAKSFARSLSRSTTPHAFQTSRRDRSPRQP
jgi:hypothetical protein